MHGGTRVGPHEIAASIGAGGMGEVFRARHTRLNRGVAIKVLPAHFVSDAGRLRRFEQEAKTLSALNHPNILTLHDAAMHDWAELNTSADLAMGWFSPSSFLPCGRKNWPAPTFSLSLRDARENGIEWPGLVSHTQRHDPGRPMRPKLGRAASALLRAARAAAAGGWVVCLMVARLGAGEATEVAPGAAARTNTFLHPVVIKRPAGRPKVATGLTNLHGQPVMVACSSCHATTQPNIETRATAELDQFHQGLKYVHGNLTCLSCHNANNYDTLRLADSRSLEFHEVMTLCSQCHGPQRRDYDMGLHGGMNGHWDLTKGGRTRSTCINCHDPHAPAFPLVMPVFPPRDRISVPAKPNATPAQH